MKPANMALRSTLFILSLRSAEAFTMRSVSQIGTSRLMSTGTTETSASVSSMIENDKVLTTLNNQITNEFTASQLYLSASIWCERRELVGMASYMRSESDEERSHALSIVDFANKRQMPLQVQALSAPPSEWKSVVDLWEALLKAEQENTKALKKLDAVAEEQNDTVLSTFLDPFHLEQVESENSLRTILAKARDMEETPGLLRQLDNELGERATS